ncbi:MAG: hypothetical protein MJD61_08050 [Proteobacteria bacterium]|nr:hypothetical protein [Pseudomonadota bacterium]
MSHGVASLLLAFASAGFMVAGLLTTVVPVVGSLFAFGSPALALAGIVLGGVAMSRAAAQGMSSNAGLAGLVLSVVAFVPASLVALTCGVCNVCVSTGAVHTPHGTHLRFDRVPGPGSTTVNDAPELAPSEGVDASNPALPPPPLAPGPTEPPPQDPDRDHRAPL